MLFYMGIKHVQIFKLVGSRLRPMLFYMSIKRGMIFNSTVSGLRPWLFYVDIKLESLPQLYVVLHGCQANFRM